MNIFLVSQNASPGFTIFRKDFIRYLVNQGHQGHQGHQGICFCD